jgi:hypothetical protein
MQKLTLSGVTLVLLVASQALARFIREVQV